MAADWCQKTFVFFCPIRSQSGGDRLELVWQDIVPKGSSRRSLLFFEPYFPARLEFPSPPLSAPGSPRILFQLNRPILKPVWSVCLATAPVIRTSLLTIFTVYALKNNQTLTWGSTVINGDQQSISFRSFSRRVFADLVLQGTRSSAKSKEKTEYSLHWGTIFICSEAL